MVTPFHRELINSFPVLAEGLIENLVKAADQADIERIALVGGIVRDHLIYLTLNQPPRKLFDIDLIIEDDPEKLAKSIMHLLGKSRVFIKKINHIYQTIELTVDGINIDIARARIEKYPILAANPEIKPTCIEDDLSRRDFTINALALDLRSNQVIDCLNGKEAIVNRKLNFIHPKSVAEDPTRIIRAARYAARLKFQLTQESTHQIQTTINLWPWEVSLENKSEFIPQALSSRLKMELRLLLEEEDN